MAANSPEAFSLDEMPLVSEIRLLLQVALAIFVVTVVIGILNGTDAVDFSHRQLLTHVHAGTLGWITLCAMAASLWLFGQGDFSESSRTAGRRLALMAAVIVPIYVLVFFTTTGYIRPVAGVATGLVFFLFLGWVASRITHVEMTVPRLAILAAVASSAVGAVLGVVLGAQIASNEKLLPTGGEDAHPAMMVIGFLVPVGMALAEWALRYGKGDLPVGKAGKVQVALPFIGGLLVMVGLLLDADPLIALSLPFEIIGVGIFIKRLWPDLSSIDFISGGQERFCAFSVLFLPLDLAWFTYLIVKYEGDLDLAPTRFILALDHMLFIGVITNAVIALMTLATLNAGQRIWAWADSLILVGMNAGLALFVLGLMTDSAVLKQIGTPIMGTAILLALLTFTLRFQTSRPGRPALAT